MNGAEYRRGYLDGVLAASRRLAQEADRHGRRAQKAIRLKRVLAALNRDDSRADRIFMKALQRRGECVRAMLVLEPLETQARIERLNA
jgi:hypothetical protein